MEKKPKQIESDRLIEISRLERPHWEAGRFVAGADEVGRGPLAGPVVASVVLLPPGCLIDHVNDSKKLSETRREALYPIILEKALSYGLGWVSPEQIDKMNIRNATLLAFRLSYEAMIKKPDVLFVDGRDKLDVPVEQVAIIHGDAVSHSIAAASIIAKVERDRYMAAQHELYPKYGFARNKGYGTAEHIAAIREAGSCPIHRKSFIGHFVGKS